MSSERGNCCISRRTLLVGAAGVAAASVFPGSTFAQTSVPADQLIDFHAHFLPQAYLDKAIAAGQGPDGMPAWPAWSVDDHLFLMDLTGVGVSVLSLSTPGVHFGDDAAAAALARLVNDEAASLASSRGDRFKFLASLPLPDVDASILEWQRVRDAPGCVGAIVMSHSGGLYPGDPRFEPLWREMNATPSIVLVHPTSPKNWQAVSPARPRPLFEFYFESARACFDMFKAGVVDRFSNLRVVIPHCGGALPIAFDRVMMLASSGLSTAPDSAPGQMRKLWFDSAGAPFPTQLPALMKHASAEQVVYGSDFCFTPSIGVLGVMNSIRSAPVSPLGTPWLEALTQNGHRLLVP